MSKKMTVSELRQFIQEKAMRMYAVQMLNEQKSLVENQLNELGFDQNGNPYGFEDSEDEIQAHHEKEIESGNIYRNKYNLLTIDKPIIPDAVKVLERNPKSIKFTSKMEFVKFAEQQRYFSASHSHCFYSLEEMKMWSSKHVKDPDSEQSEILFDAGHELVQVWDNKNNIGYIVPAKKSKSEIGESSEVANDTQSVSQEVHDEIEMRMRPTDSMLPYDEINEIAEEYGVDIEYVAQAIVSYVIHRDKEKEIELKSLIREIINVDFQGNAPDFNTFYAKFKEFDDHDEYDAGHVKKIYISMTTDPNQLSLFENKKNKKIFINLPISKKLFIFINK